MSLRSTGVGVGDKAALIVVDMSNGFTDTACPLGADCPDTIAAVQQLLELFRSKNLPVIFTTVIYTQPEQSSVFRQKLPDLEVLTEGSHWVEIDKRLARRSDEKLVIKHAASAFFDTDLASHLRERQVDTTVVVGLTTSGCVRATAVDALQHNFRVIVPEEAVADRDAAAHAANLFDLNKKYADVLSLDDVVSRLLNAT